MLVILCITDTYTTYSAFYIKILNYIYIFYYLKNTIHLFNISNISTNIKSIPLSWLITITIIILVFGHGYGHG